MIFREFHDPNHTAYPYLCGMMMAEKDGLVVLTVNYPIQTASQKWGVGYKLHFGVKGEPDGVSTEPEDHLKLQQVAHHQAQILLCPRCWDRVLREAVGGLFAKKLIGKHTKKIWCECGYCSRAVRGSKSQYHEDQKLLEQGQKRLPAPAKQLAQGPGDGA